MCGSSPAGPQPQGMEQKELSLCLCWSKSVPEGPKYLVQGRDQLRRTGFLSKGWHGNQKHKGTIEKVKPRVTGGGQKFEGKDWGMGCLLHGAGDRESTMKVIVGEDRQREVGLGSLPEERAFQVGYSW